jgi:hypothetical protein
MQNQETVKNEPIMHANVGEHIGYELGAKMIKDYYDEKNEGGAHFMGKNILEQILNQPGCIGIKIFRGLNENGKLAYVLVGVNENNSLISGTAVVTPSGQIKNEEGIVADRARLIGWYDFTTE